ncbi:DUF6931 family protein [Rahnella woolbedingensis]|uniref:Uncharacterized protein n=1 Tax=Rahnella woolbedingensis TaxID=1510574 RepID=A0A419N386_9GAMM|nr:hypothetical protein [Rahnella woolbedingensis]RJT36255.1 hypothetical protein D6C13_22560 [Rahnella woolbedingensis]
MSDSNYRLDVPEWQRNALQLASTEQWEKSLTLWVEHVKSHELSLWLLKRIVALQHEGSTSLLGEMQRWYVEPEEKLRWKVFYHAEKLGFDTPAGALALSLFWSQGSMSPEGLEPVYPEPHLSGLMLRCVLVMLAALDTDSPARGAAGLLTQWFHQEIA